MSRHIKWFYIVMKVICVAVLWFGLPDLSSEISLKIRLSDNMTHGTMISVLVFLVGDVIALATLFSDRIARWTTASLVIVIGKIVSWFLLLTTYEISISEWMVEWHPDSYVLSIGVLQFVVIDVIALFIVSCTIEPDEYKALSDRSV